ncbi:hypothetical protein E2C01_020498 [Portunus trituberculatus]|uniref:Uncharacterized protein n=1 Tax=Portunus trituberculatus TaxID=210409 RepID=A0A5B7E016_PORTR|nr:hypothetical protein [Portunus trituberculatus]
MHLGGDMGPNMGTTINKIACVKRKLNSASHIYSSSMPTALWIITLWAALVAECAGDGQELLVSSSSFLMDALEDAQQGYLRLSEKHSDVLREHLQVLGDLQLLRQERASAREAGDSACRARGPAPGTCGPASPA